MANLTPAPTNERVLSAKVSEKGAVSVYGLHSRFPVTLYADQWLAVLGKADTIRAFIEANKAKLSAQPEGKAVTGGTAL